MKLTAIIDVGELYAIVAFGQRSYPKVYVGSLEDLRPRLYKLLMEWSATHMYTKQLNAACQRVQDKLLHESPELAYDEYTCVFQSGEHPPISQTLWFEGVSENSDE